MTIRYSGVFKLLAQGVILAMVSLVMAVPVMRAAHSHMHADGEHQCENRHNGDDHTSNPDAQCELCAFYARFVPRDACAIASFSFATLITIFFPKFEYLHDELLHDGQRQGFTNKGPPSLYPLI